MLRALQKTALINTDTWIRREDKKLIISVIISVGKYENKETYLKPFELRCIILEVLVCTDFISNNSYGILLNS